MAEQPLQAPIRLNKLIASQLNVGRRQADTLIEAGRVRINGRPAQLGARVQPSKDIVSMDGKPLAAVIQTFTYLLLNKPVGYVCSRRQQGNTPTIYTLLPKQYQHLKAVGRLDKDSSGLLLLTNDGDTAHRFMHPSFGKLKRYEAALDKPLSPLHKQTISEHGLQLPDGSSKLQLERPKENDDKQWLVSMHEGRNRQIRRTFAALGYTVTRLHRIQFGPMLLGELVPKHYTEIPKP
jgi:23S rRNA pseudouridine2605 synthase